VFLKEHLALVKTFLQEHSTPPKLFLQEHFYLTSFVQTRWAQMFLEEHFWKPLDKRGDHPKQTTGSLVGMFLQEHSAGSWDYLEFSSTVSFSVVFLQEHSAALWDSRHVLNVPAGTLAAWSC